MLSKSCIGRTPANKPARPISPLDIPVGLGLACGRCRQATVTFHWEVPLASGLLRIANPLHLRELGPGLPGHMFLGCSTSIFVH